MTGRRKTAARPLTLKDAFETEFARREMERRAREEAERRQQEADLAGAEALHAALTADAEFLASRSLTADRRRYTVALDHERFRISAYFEAGSINVTLSDKRAAAAGASVPRRQETVEGVPAALRAIAQFLVDEIR
ncbi:MAG: hypothetical protein ACTHLH_06380 [Solirubrobacterales bacterium]